MDTKKPDFGNVFFSDRGHDAGSNSDRYAGASEIARDLKSPLLAELKLTNEIQTWASNLSLLTDYGWTEGCDRVAQELVRLRETSPLDIVAVVGLSDDVYLKPLLGSLSLVMRGLLQRVVLVDCDLRSPSLHTITGSETKEGFIDMIKYGCSFFTAASETEMGGIYVISAGSHPVSSEEELMGRELEQVFHSLRAKADMIFVRMKPFLSDGRVNPILSHMDGVLLCVNKAGSRRAAIARDFSRLWQSDIPVVGIVSQKSLKAEPKRTIAPEYVPKKESRPEDVRTISRARETSSGEDEWKGVTVAPHTTEAPFGESRVQETPESQQEHRIGGAEAGETYVDEIDVNDTDADEIEVDETDVVETTLFGKKSAGKRLPLIIGLCVVAAIVGILAVRQAGLLAPEGPAMDSRTTRSILLPGSDGVTNAIENHEETSAPVTERASSPGDAADATVSSTRPPDLEEVVESEQKNEQGTPEVVKMGAMAQPPRRGEKDQEDGRISTGHGTTLVHVSSFRSYENAAKDSSRIATAGLKTSIALVEFEDLGTWYRVLVGPFAGTEEAEVAASKLTSLGLARNVRIISEGGTE